MRAHVRRARRAAIRGEGERGEGQVKGGRAVLISQEDLCLAPWRRHLIRAPVGPHAQDGGSAQPAGRKVGQVSLLVRWRPSLLILSLLPLAVVPWREGRGGGGVSGGLASAAGGDAHQRVMVRVGVQEREEHVAVGHHGDLEGVAHRLVVGGNQVVEGHGYRGPGTRLSIHLLPGVGAVQARRQVCPEAADPRRPIKVAVHGGAELVIILAKGDEAVRGDES
mmetsp:Transcript_43899/g.113669  ORF Transcript_43899/g.113669 Transcript_43899/m.113669 type:complete len:222 (+) Transcript_43899:1320-1985(+)